MRRLSLTGVVLLAWPALAAAALDAEERQPYELKLVVHFSENRIFTAVFREQTRRELHDWFQGALGDLAAVEVTEDHPLLPQILAKGLTEALNGRLEPIGSWRPISGVKTHFLLIDHKDGAYEIQARQQDGSTGLASPVVRRGRTPDRQLVARVAARLVQLDFGVVGTLAEVPPRADTPEVLVTFKAGGLGAPLDPWVHQGDVFAIAQITGGRGVEQSFRVPAALLQAIEAPHDGVCRCRLYHRYQNPLAGGGSTLGFRCLKLGTAVAPVKLHLVGERLLPLDFSVHVGISRTGFEDRQVDEPPVSRGGLVETDPRHPYTAIAFVKVFSGTTLLARVPVPVIEGHVEIISVSDRREVREAAEFQIRRRHALQQINEARALVGQLFKEITETHPHEAALQRARSGLEELDKEISARQGELDALARDAKEARVSEKLDLTEAEAGIRDLNVYRDKLKEHIGLLEGVTKEETSPGRRDVVDAVGQAQAAEASADYGKAIERYQEALKGPIPAPQKGELQRHLAELQRIWSTKSPAHEEAKRFFETVWPALATPRDLKQNLASARRALDACKAAGDFLTPRRFVLANVAHGNNLRKRIETVQSQDTEDARAEVKTIGEVGAELEKLDKEARAYVEANASKVK